LVERGVKGYSGGSKNTVVTRNEVKGCLEAGGFKILKKQGNGGDGGPPGKLLGKWVCLHLVGRKGRGIVKRRKSVAHKGNYGREKDQWRWETVARLSWGGKKNTNQGGRETKGGETGGGAGEPRRDKEKGRSSGRERWQKKAQNPLVRRTCARKNEREQKKGPEADRRVLV